MFVVISLFELTAWGAVFFMADPTLVQKEYQKFDSAGNVLVNMNTLLAGEDLTNGVFKVEQRFSAQALLSLVTVVAKSGSGFLHCLTVGALSLPTVYLYDNTAASGTILGTLNAGCPPGTYFYDVSFSTGLTIQPLPGTTILPCFTVSYR